MSLRSDGENVLTGGTSNHFSPFQEALNFFFGNDLHGRQVRIGQRS